MLSPHGIPVDLLDRLVIIRTLQYVLEEIIAILNTRAKVSLQHILLLFAFVCAQFGEAICALHANSNLVRRQLPHVLYSIRSAPCTLEHQARGRLCESI